MEAQVPNSWSTFAVFFVVTGMFSLVWSTVIESFKVWLTRRRERRYLAARTAAVLESYAIACWRNMLMANGHFDRLGEPYIDALPAPPALPEDVDWKSFSPALSAKIFTFINDISIEEGFAEYARIHENNAFDFETATQKLGRDAWALSSEVRSSSGLPSRDSQRSRLAELDK